MNRIALVAVIAVALAAGSVAADDISERTARIARVSPDTASAPDLVRPDGLSRWDLEGLNGGVAFERTIAIAGDGTVTLTEAFGDTVTSVRFLDDGSGDAALWLMPDRDRESLRMGERRTLLFDRDIAGQVTHHRVDVETIGIGWAMLPSGPREVVLQRALVLTASEDSRAYEIDRTVDRWVDPRGGVVAETSGPASEDGRRRLSIGTVEITEQTLTGLADLKIRPEELNFPVDTAVRFGNDLGEGTLVDGLVPQSTPTISDLIALDNWDFSGNTGGVTTAASSVTLAASESCNVAPGSCGFVVDGRTMERQDIGIGAGEELRKDNNIIMTEDDGSKFTIWLNAGAQKEGRSGAFGTGETRFCWEGSFENNQGQQQQRTQVPLWQFQHQDADGYFLQNGDAWVSDPMQCDESFYVGVCGTPAILFPTQWSNACSSDGVNYSGTQGGSVVKAGVVTLPSGHTVNALVVETLADFCVFSGKACRTSFPSQVLQEVSAHVHLFQVPNMGTVALLRSPLNVWLEPVPGPGNYDNLDNAEFRYGLYPPVTIAAGTATETTIDISWNPGNITSHINGYKVYWDTDTGATSDYAFNSVDNSGQITIAGTTATISGLTAGTDYYITVTSMSDYQNPDRTSPTTYESIRFPTQVSGDPSFVYPVEVMATTGGGACTPTEEVTGLVVDKIGTDTEICWDLSSDPCVTGYEVLGANSPEAAVNFTPIGNVGVQTCWTGTPTESYFLVRSTGTGGSGPLGHFE